MSFVAIYSTNDINRDEDLDRCLTDDLDAMDEAIAALQTGKANTVHGHDGYATADHTHAGYAAAAHTHDGYAVEDHTHTEYAESDHTHAEYAEAGHVHDGYAEEGHTHTEYAAANHGHTEYAAAQHTHAQADITGLADALAGKAATTHTHADKADLVDGKVPASQLPSYVSDVAEYANLAAFPAAGASDRIYVAQDTNKAYRWSGTQYVEIAGGVALGETAATAYRGDHGKAAYDHSQNDTVHVTAAQKTAWDGKAAADHTHDALYAALAHKHYPATINYTGEDLNNYTDAGIWSFTSGSAPAHMPTSNVNGWLIVIPWNEGNPTIKQIWLRHGTVGSNDYGTYVRTKVGSGEWGEWSQFYTTSNPPTAAEVGAIAKALQFTSNTGGAEVNVYAADETSVFTVLEGFSTGVHTVYSQAGVSGNPESSLAYRLLIHKTSTAYMWVMAFCADGSVYNNYQNNGTWRGWRQLYSTANPPTAAEVGAISKELQFTSDTGDVKESLTGKDVLATIGAKPTGVYTFYAAGGTTNNPRSTGSWRYLCHKTSATFGWVMAFCGDGSVYSNYQDTGNWQGWRVIYEAGTPAPLWSGAKLMGSSDTVTPSKPLSECRNGWMLEFSDYNNDSASSANSNFVQIPVYKRNAVGVWNGRNMLFTVPNYVSDDATTINSTVKQLIVHDTKLVGHVSNNQGTNNLDVCLRAVYEF